MSTPLDKARIGIIGATSMVGDALLPLLVNAGYEVVAYTRSQGEALTRLPDFGQRVEWRHIDAEPVHGGAGQGAIEQWVCLAPIWVLPGYGEFLAARGARKLVAISSTSRFTKSTSSSPAEREIAARLAHAEQSIMDWARETGVDLIIFQPTLIYGMGRDQNISEIARFVRRFGFFPLFGPARGLRQPLYAGDVAEACLQVLKAELTGVRIYPLSGAEVVPYEEMVRRVFARIGKPARILRVPMWVFRLAIRLIRWIPRYRKLTPAMAERMNQDMLFSHDAAVQDFGFAPRQFELAEEDLPD